MPSRISPLLATWLYSDIASTPSAWPSLRMLSDSIPFSSAKATAARSTRSRLRGVLASVAGLAGPPICRSAAALTCLHRESTLNLRRKPATPSSTWRQRRSCLSTPSRRVGLCRASQRPARRPFPGATERRSHRVHIGPESPPAGSTRPPYYRTPGVETMKAIVQDASHRTRGGSPARRGRQARDRRRRDPGAGACRQRGPGHLASDGRPGLPDAPGGFRVPGAQGPQPGPQFRGDGRVRRRS